MTRFSSRPNRSNRTNNRGKFGATTGFVAAFAAFALLAISGCDDKHIGRPCCLDSSCGADAAAPLPTNVAVNSEALECPSRVCLLPNQGKSTNTGPFCTDTCSSDDDCAGGEKRTDNSAGSTDRRCQTGFVCRVVVPNLANTALSCQKVCTCSDFIDPNAGPPMGC